MYCRGLGLPFPRVEPSPQDQRQPKECHLFSDPTCPEAPVLLHFPLVNASFKDHSAPGEAASPSITAWQPWALPSAPVASRGGGHGSAWCLWQMPTSLQVPSVCSHCAAVLFVMTPCSCARPPPLA